MRLGNILATDLIDDKTLVMLSFPFEERNKRERGHWSEPQILQYIDFEVNYIAYYPTSNVIIIYLGQIR